VVEVFQLISKVTVIKLFLLTFVVSSMFTMGVSQKLRDVLAPLCKPRFVLGVLSVNFVVAPLVALLLTRLIPLEPAFAFGLILLGCAAGSPFLPKLVEIAGVDLAQSVAMMLLLVIGTILFMPLVLPLLIPGVSVSHLDLASPLIITMLLPLATGFLVSWQFEQLAARIAPAVGKVATFCFILLVIFLFGLNLDTIASTLGSGGIVSYILFMVLSMIVGYLVGGLDLRSRGVLVLGTGQRNIAAALVTASACFNDAAVLLVLLVLFIAGLALELLIARWLRRLISQATSAGR